MRASLQLLVSLVSCYMVSLLVPFFQLFLVSFFQQCSDWAESERKGKVNKLLALNYHSTQCH